MEASKVTLSIAERRLVTDANIILTKNSIIEKVYLLFGQLAVQYQQQSRHLAAAFPGIFGLHPKISRGEKYRDLPWVMLDYPRCFDKQKGQLAIRSFFWWGNYFSIQLQVSGIYKKKFLDVLPGWQPIPGTWLGGFTTDAWDYELPNPHWKSLFNDAGETNESASDEDHILKLAKKIPIDEWENVEKLLGEYFSQLIQLTDLAINYPNDERGLLPGNPIAGFGP